MTESEKFCEELGKLYFFKELIKSDLLYVTEGKQEKELADIILRVGNNVIPIQIKEKNKNNNSDTSGWLKNRVYKAAKKQIEKTNEQILETINFKSENNSDILNDIELCNIIPLIIFDIGDEVIEYNKLHISKSSDLNIQIFNIKDFKEMCEKLIAPMEMLRYIKERENYINRPVLIFEEANKIIVANNENENDMLQFYIEKHTLVINDINKAKLIKFNSYLSLFEKHCINNKEHYKFFIKIISPFPINKIYQFIDRIDLIIEKGKKKEIYWDSYIIDSQLSVLFISLPNDKYNEEFIAFVSNVFMHKFKLDEVLTIINCSLDDDVYDLYFAFCKYSKVNNHLYEEAIEQGFAKMWNNSKVVNQ